MSMFKGLGRGHFALGLSIGALATTFLFVWVFSWFRDPANQRHCDYNKAGENCEETQNLTGFQFSEFVYVTPVDTLAQWIMAVFSVAATGLSIWAVWLVRKTLVEAAKTTKAAIAGTRQARRAADTALVDLEAAMRPKLIVRREQLFKNKKGIYRAEVMVENMGERDAKIGRSDFTFIDIRNGYPIPRKYDRYIGTEINPFEPNDGKIIKVGETLPWQFLDKEIKEPEKTALIGRIIYTKVSSTQINAIDENGKRQYRVFFCRVFDPKTQRFVPIENDPEYERAD